MDREWYVNDFLIPSMLEQGIPRESIEVWLDRMYDGNLKACLKCFKYCGEKGSGRWHMQDDVVISRDFKEKTEKYDEGIVSGFMRINWQGLTPHAGVVPAVYMWNSFQCIRIPDSIAGEFVRWFYDEATKCEEYKDKIRANKYDDWFFNEFIQERHKDDDVTNLKPSIVDHIDFLLGGSVINKWRGHLARGDLWEDDVAYEEMKDKLARR